MRILYKFPNRERPEKFFAAIDNIHELSTHDDFIIQATFDLDDPTTTTPEFKERLKYYPKVRAMWGTSTGKIHACNRDMEFSGEWGICILMSDDQKFLVKGFDSIIVEKMKHNFPDGDGVLHFPDSHGKFELIVLSIMGRKYFNRFGYLYDPEFYSVYADNQFTDVARMLNCYAFIPMRIFDHFHFIWGMCQKDALYARNENPANYQQDNMTYIRHKSNNFGINIFQ